jgi:hypothetical protein
LPSFTRISRILMPNAIPLTGLICQHYIVTLKRCTFASGMTKAPPTLQNKIPSPPTFIHLPSVQYHFHTVPSPFLVYSRAIPHRRLPFFNCRRLQIHPGRRRLSCYALRMHHRLPRHLSLHAPKR